MTTLNATEARANLFRLIAEASQTHRADHDYRQARQCGAAG